MNNVLFKKMLGFVGIGIICFIVGLSYGIPMHDKVFCLLSLSVLAMCACKAVDLYLIDKKKKYKVITGKCIEQTYNILGRYRNIKIDTGKEYIEISVPKNVKVKNEHEYLFYFRENQFDYDSLNKTIKERFLTDSFLGYEISQTQDIYNLN